MGEAKMSAISRLFYVDNLSIVMGLLILFVAFCVGSFSWRYLKGDSAQKRFYAYLSLLSISTLVLVCTDQLPVFITAWGASNLLLARLMVHKFSWTAAREAGKLTLRNSAISFASLSIAGFLLYAETKTTSLRAILSYNQPIPSTLTAISLIFVAAMAQSAQWPFHRWLTSSLNSPTPVSAMMHAGLVNGGGFLLARFAPLYIQQPDFFQIVFAIGFVTAFLGTLWKLMQSDVKRMLACSTMGQMGFMVMQCGLGLFPAAIAHLVWHGLFKAYLFLASGAAAQEKRIDLGYPPSLPVFLTAAICGILGAYAFSVAGQINLAQLDTRLFLVGMSFIASTQLALPILEERAVKKIHIALMAVGIVGTLYGWSVHAFERLIPGIAAAQPLNILHLAAFLILVLAWLAVLFARNRPIGGRHPKWLLALYVSMLNASQPHPLTVTAHRNDYQYK